jgi:ribosomal protein S17E
VQHEDYPALFLDADSASNRYQATFLTYIRGEYLTLLLAAVFSMSFLDHVAYYLLYAAVFVVGLIILLSRALSKPEQSWYRCRALAESVKTLTWRYMMHATPFASENNQAMLQFRDELHELFRQNSDTAKQITGDYSGNHQITEAMRNVRTKALSERMAYYLEHRVDEQRSWYTRKSRSSRTAARFWVTISGIAYVTAGSMALSRIALPDWKYWPIEPLIVVAASIVGWMQIKKYNELAAAYSVTAHEIGLIRPKADVVVNEVQFSDFVNDAEKAFSREHTLWIARQSD